MHQIGGEYHLSLALGVRETRNKRAQSRMDLRPDYSAQSSAVEVTLNHYFECFMEPEIALFVVDGFQCFE